MIHILHVHLYVLFEYFDVVCIEKYVSNVR